MLNNIAKSEQKGKDHAFNIIKWHRKGIVQIIDIECR